MYRRFNYTKRREIERQHCQINLHRIDDDRAYFSAQLQLDDYEFDPSAGIRIDAWRSNASQRWEFGAIGDPATPPQAERILRDVPITAQFKVSVVASDGSGRLLGVSPALKPKREEEPKESLLPVELDDGLGNEVWRLDFGDGHERPVLKINSKIEGGGEMVAGDQVFRPLVLPEVFRGVLRQAILIQRVDLDDTADNAWSDWLKLARLGLDDKKEPPALGNDADPEKLAEAADWIDRAVAAFAAKHEFMTPESFAEVLAGRS